MSPLQISIRDLHARTGHFVRKATISGVVVTDRGRPIAEIRPISTLSEDARKIPYFARRTLIPSFKKLTERRTLSPKKGQKSIDEILDEVRDDRTA